MYVGIRAARLLLATSLCAITAAAADATETIVYSYDGLGRLTKVERSGDGNAASSADYSYDATDNRTNVTVAVAGPAPPPPPPSPPPSSPPPPPPPPPGNQPPAAVADSKTYVVWNGGLINVVANDTDADGDYPLTLTAVTGSSYASVENATSVRWLGTGRDGVYTLTYTIQDARGATSTGTLTVTVTAN